MITCQVRNLVPNGRMVSQKGGVFIPVRKHHVRTGNHLVLRRGVVGFGVLGFGGCFNMVMHNVRQRNFRHSETTTQVLNNPLHRFGPILQVHEVGHWLKIHIIYLIITQVSKGANVCKGDLVCRNTARDPLTVADEEAAELQVVLGSCRDALSGIANHCRLSLGSSIRVGHHATWLADVVAEAFNTIVVEELEFINRIDPLDVGDHGSHIMGESQMGQSGSHGSNGGHLVSLLSFSFCHERVVLDPFLVFGKTQKNDALYFLGFVVRVSSANHNGLWESSYLP